MRVAACGVVWRRRRGGDHSALVAGGCVAICCEGGDGVAAASCTASPLCNVSGGLSITRSDGERPALTSTLLPKSRPSWMDLSTTLVARDQRYGRDAHHVGVARDLKIDLAIGAGEELAVRVVGLQLNLH